MVDVETPPAKAPDKATRSAALWATAVAVPVAVLAGLLMFWRLVPQGETAAQPSPSATAAPSVPATPVQMAAPKLAAHAAQVCLAVTSQLPTEVRDLPARKVSAGPEQNAAYGEPPITVACGVPQPTTCEKLTGGHPGCVPLDADLLVMNGVCWYGEDGPATKFFTTLDREVAVRVAVPASYDQPGQWANEFSDAVVKTVKSKDTGVPTGCHN
jgi:Protein of unknown function (DUF3515)